MAAPSVVAFVRIRTPRVGAGPAEATHCPVLSASPEPVGIVVLLGHHGESPPGGPATLVRTQASSSQPPRSVPHWCRVSVTPGTLRVIRRAEFQGRGRPRG